MLHSLFQLLFILIRSLNCKEHFSFVIYLETRVQMDFTSIPQQRTLRLRFGSSELTERRTSFASSGIVNRNAILKSVCNGPNKHAIEYKE